MGKKSKNSSELFTEITFGEFVRVAPHIIDAGYPVMIRGRHGIGKSELIYQIAEQYCKLPVVERRCSQMDVGDLVGLPLLEEMEKSDGTNQPATKYAPPDWLAKACNEPVVLFLDEVDRAVLEVAQGVFELCDSRKINGHTLHPDTKIFAACNGGASGAEYQVREMDPAELDRWCCFDVRPSVKDWLQWAETYGNVENLVLEFISLNQEHLEHIGMHDASVVYPSRRSWVRFDRVLKNIGDYYTFSGLENIASAIIGIEAAVSFGDFVRSYGTAVTIEDILKGTKKKTWSKPEALEFEQYNLVGRHLKDEKEKPDYWKTNKIPYPEVDSPEMDNLRDFLLVMPDETLANVMAMAAKPIQLGLTHASNFFSGKKKLTKAEKDIIAKMEKLKAKYVATSRYAAMKETEEQKAAE
jgi:hypothetical protein